MSSASDRPLPGLSPDLGKCQFSQTKTIPGKALTVGWLELFPGSFLFTSVEVGLTSCDVICLVTCGNFHSM